MNEEDDQPPSKPDAQGPTGNICQNRPTFSWKRSTDDVGINHYHIKVYNSDNSFTFEADVKDNFENTAD